MRTHHGLICPWLKRERLDALYRRRGVLSGSIIPLELAELEPEALGSGVARCGALCKPLTMSTAKALQISR